MKVLNHSSIHACKQSRSTTSQPRAHAHLSEIFQNTRSLSNEDFGTHALQKIHTLDQLIEFFGISKKSLSEPETQLDIGLKYLNGVYPLQADNEKARYWITKAADLRFPRAEFILGTSFACGTFTEKNNWLAYIYLKQAVEHGVTEAEAMLYYVTSK